MDRKEKELELDTDKMLNNILSASDTNKETTDMVSDINIDKLIDSASKTEKEEIQEVPFKVTQDLEPKNEKENIKPEEKINFDKLVNFSSNIETTETNENKENLKELESVKVDENKEISKELETNNQEESKENSDIQSLNFLNNTVTKSGNNTNNQEIDNSRDEVATNIKDDKEQVNTTDEPITSTLSPNKNSKRVPIIILLILAILGVGLISYKIFILDKMDNDDTNQNNETEEKSLYTYYLKKEETDFTFTNSSDNCEEDCYKINTETNSAKALYVDYDYTYLLLEDNGLKLYNLKSNQITKINLEGNFIKDQFRYNFSNDREKVVGIIYKETDSEYNGYYDVSKNKKILENTYDNMYPTESEKYITANRGLDSDIQNVLINVETEKEVFSGDTWYDVRAYKDKNYIFVSHDIDGNDQTVYTEDKIEITNVSANYSGKCYDIYEGNLYAFKNGQIKKYDINGKLLNSKEFSEKDFKNIVNNMVLYMDKDNYLSLYNIDTEKSVQIVKWDSDYNFDLVEYYNEEDKEPGIYISIYYQSGQDENGNYGIEYCYTDKGEIKTYPIEHEMGGRAKPVLYLYPEKETKVNITFEHPEYLKTTYPKFKNKWEVIASPNGDLKDKDGKYYYALYWDEVRYHEVDFKEGFYVTKENAIEFLEEKLTTIGLNPKERNEFIMYWLPILEKNEKNLVYFELTKEREQYNKLNILPKPDSMLRVAIHIKKVDSKKDIKEQKLETFKRNGFVAVEWGGMTY